MGGIVVVLAILLFTYGTASPCGILRARAGHMAGKVGSANLTLAIDDAIKQMTPAQCMTASVRRTPSALLGKLVGWTPADSGQGAAPGISPAEAGAAAQLRNELNRIRGLQDLHYVFKASTYASDLASLNYVPPKGVSIEISQASADGWAGQAWYTGKDGVYCSVNVGQVYSDTDSPALMAGAIGCTTDPQLPKSRGALLKDLMNDLRNLQGQQELYYSNPANNYTYADAISKLTDLQAADGVAIEITWASSEGHAAVAWLTSDPSARCALFMGKVPEIPSPATVNGVVGCNE